MSDKRQLPNIETSKDVKMPVSNKEEPGLPVKIPLSVIRWLAYSVYCSGMLSWWYPQLVGVWGYIGTSLLLGHFASQLNELIKK
jgi:hypothetical protein